MVGDRGGAFWKVAASAELLLASQSSHRRGRYSLRGFHCFGTPLLVGPLSLLWKNHLYVADFYPALSTAASARAG
jgi:hypothetical protein